MHALSCTAAAVKFEDPLGTALPPASQPFCDAWKRSEELLHGAPNVPMVCLKPAADADKKGDGTRNGSRCTFAFTAVGRIEQLLCSHAVLPQQHDSSCRQSSP